MNDPLKLNAMRFDTDIAYVPKMDELCYVRVRIDGRGRRTLESIAQERFAALAVRHGVKIGRIERAVEDDNVMWYYARRVG